MKLRFQFILPIRLVIYVGSSIRKLTSIYRRHGLSMKRWFYILLGGLGMALASAAAFALFVSSDLPPAFSGAAYHVVEGICVACGLVLGLIGFINGREAGELDIRKALKASRKRDHHVNGKEIDFECPICHKGYRASPMLAGKPFTCRECREIFEVPLNSVATLPALPNVSVVQA